MATSTLTLLAKLPDGVLFENVESIEVKITTKGVELSGQHRLADRDHDSIREAKTICVELTPISQEQSMRIKDNNQGATFRKASVSATPSKLPLYSNVFQFEQSKNLITEVQRKSALTEDMHYHSLPETKVAQPVDISRPHSDTDISTFPCQTQDDATPSRKLSLHVKGGEKLILEEPFHEGLSVNIDEVDYAEDEQHEEETCDPLSSLVSHRTRTMFYIPDSPTTPIAEASPFLMLNGPTQAESTPGLSKNVIGSGVDLSFYLKNEYSGHNTVFRSEAVFPSQKPFVSTGGGDQFPDVYVGYSSRPTIWPEHQYTENPMRYDVGMLPKKSMNDVYYSLDERFAFKEERNKILLIKKKDVFQRIIHLDPNKFVPIIAYLHDGRPNRDPTVGYQIMEYYKDGSIHDLFKVCVAKVQCNCFLEIYQKIYEKYSNAKKERDKHRSPYMFNLPPQYYLKLEGLEKEVSYFSIQLENLVRNFNTIVVQMLEAVMSLHSHNLIHRDIKPHNFLVKRLESCHCPQLIFCSCEQPGFQVLLGDYDFVTFATDEQWDFLRTKYEYSYTTKRGTVGYRPIELNFNNEGVEISDPKSDIYSLGASILEILVGKNWKTCDREIEDMLTVCLSPLSKKTEESFKPQQYQEELTEKYIDLEERNTELMGRGIAIKELSEINQILASICTTESSVDINETVKQFKVLAVKSHDGIRTVLSTVIKASHVNDKCIMHCWNVYESSWICEIIQQCVKVYPQQRPHIQQLLNKKWS